jgi:LytS/YehU family sensor histidine kinase
MTVLCAASLIVPGYFLSVFLSGKTFDELFGPGNHGFFDLLIWSPLPTTVASTTLAMSIKFAKNWIQTQRRQQLLEKERLETELKFLKYQFNPHFLFNTINSIFFLIHKNPDMASDSLAKFSDLLRYQLYECNDSQILLSKEISYMENSIELEKLRLNNNVEVAVHIDDHNMENLGIAPFILMTFVENAFKHVSMHEDKPNWIRIKLDIDRQELNFIVSNSTSHGASTDVMRYGGIGLKNVQRRLDLIYPGQYDLNIQSNNNSFEIKLRINLSELEISQHMQKIA